MDFGDGMVDVLELGSCSVRDGVSSALALLVTPPSTFLQFLLYL